MYSLSICQGNSEPNKIRNFKEKGVVLGLKVSENAVFLTWKNTEGLPIVHRSGGTGKQAHFGGNLSNDQEILRTTHNWLY